MFKLRPASLLLACIYFTGCASVPMASKEQDAALKEFSAPPTDKSGIYIYRDSSFGAALKKNLYVDGALIGESASNVYFYKEITPGAHKLSTESEFSDNEIGLNTEGGKNYFVRQYIKMGLFVGGANLESATEEEGQQAVRSCKLASSTSGQDAANVNRRAQRSSATPPVDRPSAMVAAASAERTNIRYLFQAEKLASSQGCTETIFESSGPGVERYTAKCDAKPISILCEFGNCTAH